MDHATRRSISCWILKYKVDIVQNAIDRPTGHSRAHVALLSAIETVNPKISLTWPRCARWRTVGHHAVDSGSTAGLRYRGQREGRSHQEAGFPGHLGRPTFWWVPIRRAATCWLSNWEYLGGAPVGLALWCVGCAHYRSQCAQILHHRCSQAARLLSVPPLRDASAMEGVDS